MPGLLSLQSAPWERFQGLGYQGKEQAVITRGESKPRHRHIAM